MIKKILRTLWEFDFINFDKYSIFRGLYVWHWTTFIVRYYLFVNFCAFLDTFNIKFSENWFLNPLYFFSKSQVFFDYRKFWIRCWKIRTFIFDNMLMLTFFLWELFAFKRIYKCTQMENQYGDGKIICTLLNATIFN